MAFGTSSKVFVAFLENVLGNAVAYNLNTGGASLWVDIDLAVPYSAGELIARVRERGTVELDYRARDVRVRVRIAPAMAGELEAVATRWAAGFRDDA